MDMLACLKEVLPPDVDAEAIASKMQAKGYTISVGDGPPEGAMGEGIEDTGETSIGGAPSEGEPKPSLDAAITKPGDGFIRNAVRSAIEERKGKRKDDEAEEE